MVNKKSLSHSYWVMRRIFAFGLGLIFFNTFLILWNQGIGLLGQNGILPIVDFSAAVLQHFGSMLKAQWEIPSVFYFWNSDTAIRTVAILGMLCSLPLVFGFVNFPILFVLWILHLSVVHIGQIFYSYGWETQLLELTFLSFFLFPLWNPKLDRAQSPPKLVAIWFMRWMMFRLMFGAGMIKLRGDPCWLDLTCMNYHYETQPNPLPFSWLLHQMPTWFHSVGVLLNHFVELIVPFGLFGPKILRRAAGTVMIVFQVFLIMSGNLAWLNWLTILMAIPCFDDEFLLQIINLKKYSNIPILPLSKMTKTFLSAFAALGLILSVQPAMNLFSQHQLMNASFNQFHLINSYGAFGSITKERNEVIISGTNDSQITPNTQWLEYQFKCKPGNPSRSPCWVTPYHLKLDWQIWFSAMHTKMEESWLGNFAVRLLQGKNEVIDLLDFNPFPEKPPRFLKMDLYRYQYTRFGEAGWWKRTYIGPYLEPIRLN